MKLFSKFPRLFALCLVLTCLLAGCKLSTLTVFKPDGSGEMTADLLIEREYASMIVPDLRNKLRKEAVSSGGKEPPVQESQNERGDTVFRWTTPFKTPAELDSNDMRVQFQADNGFWRKHYQVGIELTKAPGDGAMFEQEYRVRVPGKIEQTNGAKVSDNEAVWSATMGGFPRGTRFELVSSETGVVAYLALLTGTLALGGIGYRGFTKRRQAGESGSRPPVGTPSPISAGTTELICIGCKQPYPAGQKFCPKCGTSTTSPPAPLPQSATENSASRSDQRCGGDQMICRNCKAELSGTPKFCPKCGARVDVQDETAAAFKRCPQCGTENPASAKFCKKDGYRFDKTVDLAPPASQVTPDLENQIAAVAAPVASRESPVVAALPVQAVEPEPAPGASISTDMLVCPECGTANEPTAKFCKRDGVALVQAGPDPDATLILPSPSVAFPATAVAAPKDTPVPEAAPVGISHGAAKTTSKGLLFGMAGAVAVAAIGVGGYMYLSAKPSAPEVPPAANTNAQVAAVPAPPENTQPEVAASAPSFMAMASQAAVPSPAPEAPAEQSPRVDAATIHQRLTQQLGHAGFGAVNVTVDSEGRVGLDGTVPSKKAKDEAVRLAFAQYGVERVDDSDLRIAAPTSPNPPPQRVAVSPATPLPVPSAAPQLAPDPAKLEGELNRALRSGGVGGVTAQVGDNLTVTLKGSVSSTSQKERAFQIARSFKGVGVTKDRIFVVDQ